MSLEHKKGQILKIMAGVMTDRVGDWNHSLMISDLNVQLTVCHKCFLLRFCLDLKFEEDKNLVCMYLYIHNKPYILLCIEGLVLLLKVTSRVRR